MDEQNVAMQSNDQETEYTAKEIKKDLLRLYASPTYQKLNAYFRRDNFFHILKKGRNENAHSNFLAWLLDSHSGHGLGTYPMECFLRMLDFSRDHAVNKDSYIPDDFSTVAFSNRCHVEDAVVIRERAVNIDGRKDSRLIDLFIECTLRREETPLEAEKYCVTIENKVYSSEGERQTQDYYEGISAEFANTGKKLIFVYLTPYQYEELETDNRQKKQPKCKAFIQISYQYLLDYVIQPCMSMDMPNDARVFMQNYIRCLDDTSYYEDEDEKGKRNRRGGSVMAVSEEVRELLFMFGDENEKLISAYNDLFMTKEDKEKFNQKREAEKAKRDNSKYLIGDDPTPYTKSEIALKIFQCYVEEHKDIDFAGLKKAFPIGGKNVFMEIQDAKRDADTQSTDNDKLFHFDAPITLGDESVIVVYKQWGSGPKFSQLIDCANENRLRVRKED